MTEPVSLNQEEMYYNRGMKNDKFLDGVRKHLLLRDKIDHLGWEKHRKELLNQESVDQLAII
jgi:hypothetical protein